jgi:hypothetical protein
MTSGSGPFLHPRSVSGGLHLSVAESNIIADLTALIIKEVPVGLSDWASVSAAFYLAADERGVGNSCYAFDPLGYSGGFTVDNVDKKALLMRLRELHSLYPLKKWIKVLLQFGRQPEQLIVTYEFQDPYRWDVNTGNYRMAIRALRAEFGKADASA